MTTFAHSVQIGPEFFKKALRDYADQFWAFAREILQNSLDCGSTMIDITIVEMSELNQTRVIVSNDGEPMTHEILTQKLLALGSSGKDFRAGSVGGFGKAKEILYFTHKDYEIHSGSWCVEGCGAGYNIESSGAYNHGTTSTVRWDGLHAERLIAEFKRFVRMSWRPDCQFIVNGELVESQIGRGRFKRNLIHDGKEWCEVRTAGNEPNLLVVRIGGTPMFTMRSDYKRTIVLELQGSSADTLTANRDGLRWQFRDQLTDFLTTLAVDKKSALRDYEPVYHRHAGRRLRIQEAVAKQPAVCVVDTGVPLAAALCDSGAGIKDEVQARHEEPAGVLAMEFIIKNCHARRDVPREFDPGSNQFSDHAHWLAESWARCLLELHRAFGIHDAFSVGFIFSEEIEAEFEQSGEYGKVYFVNPLIYSKRGHRRRFSKSEKHRLIALAAHEFVHGAFDLGRHDEEYAGKLTEVLGIVLKHVRKFNRHVK